MKIVNRLGRTIACLGLFLALLIPTISAQNDTVTVPDVSGLNVAVATARLNEAGLRLGTELPAPITDGGDAVVGTVQSQSVAGDEQLAPGTAIDLNIHSSAKITLVYDDNDFTLINHTGVTLGLNSFIFSSNDGTRRFIASRWQATLESGDCAQVWSVARFEPKNLQGCASIAWLTTSDPAEHFWMQSAGSTSFDIIENGVTRASCPSAPPNSQDNPTSCEFYIVTFTDIPATEYLYFVYTDDRFAVINTTEDSWMPLNTTPIYTSNADGAGSQLIISNYFDADTMLANPQRLAPQQCLLLIGDANITDAPELCQIVGTQVLDATQQFWRTAFELDSPFDRGERISCPAATPGRMTLCIMPRGN